jgi:hypothetical protein
MRKRGQLFSGRSSGVLCRDGFELWTAFSFLGAQGASFGESEAFVQLCFLGCLSRQWSAFAQNTVGF